MPSPTRYRVVAKHPVDIATGRSFAPGELAAGVDPKNAHDKSLIEEGALRARKAAPKAEKEEASK